MNLNIGIYVNTGRFTRKNTRNVIKISQSRYFVKKNNKARVRIQYFNVVIKKVRASKTAVEVDSFPSI